VKKAKAIEVQRKCEHYYCRCMRALELCLIADRTGRSRYILEAVQVHGQQVPCRLPDELA